MFYILTENSVVVKINGKITPIDSSNPMYPSIVAAAKKGNQQEVENLFDKSKRIKSHASGRFSSVDGQVYIDGVAIPEVLSNRLIEFSDQNIDPQPLLSFWDRLKLNPSIESKKDLYAFLENGGIALDKDGFFVAYKRVREDFRDIHSGKFDNSPGRIVTMDRDDVDPDRNRTCSAGLHCCSQEYLPEFGCGAGNKIVEVRVDPKDVVAVPTDYNNTKMRVCKYEVLREITDFSNSLIYNPNNDPVKFWESAEDNEYLEDNEVEQEEAYDDKSWAAENFEDDFENDFEDENLDNEDLEDNDSENEDLSTYAYPDKRGNVRIPAEFVKKVDGIPGWEMTAEPEGDFLNVHLDDTGTHTYTVNDDGSVRIGRNALASAGILGAKRYQISYADGELTVHRA